MVIDIYYDNKLYFIGKSIFESIIEDTKTKLNKNDINKLFNNTYFVNEEYLIESGVNKPLSNVGIQNADSKIKSSSKEIVDIIKKDGITKESRKKIHNIISDLFKDIADAISIKNVMENDELKELPRPKIKRALILFVAVLVIQSLINYILSLITPLLASKITTIVVAPIIEEAAKAISIKGDFTKEFFIVFNVFEAGMYLSNFAITNAAVKAITGNVSIKTSQMLRARGSAIGMHGLTTGIQKIMSSDKKTNDKDKKDKSTLISYIIGIIIHSSWNAANVLSPKFASMVIGT